MTGPPIMSLIPATALLIPTLNNIANFIHFFHPSTVIPLHVQFAKDALMNRQVHDGRYRVLRHHFLHFQAAR